MVLLNNQDTNQISTKTVWLLLAVAINALEFFIPRIPFFPWLKPGFANIITIIWIIEYGVVDAILYSLLRTWIVGFFFGFSFLTMSLSLSGGLFSTIIMGIAWSILGKKRIIGTVGLGIIGAIFHNLGQLCAIYGLMAHNIRLFYQIPLMCFASICFGGIVGFFAPHIRTVLLACEGSRKKIPTASIPTFSASRRNVIFSFILLLGCFSIVFTPSYFVLGLSALGATLIVQIEKKGSWGSLFRPLFSFWVLFVFIACVNLVFANGTRIEKLPFLTYEGVDNTAQQWLRLWTWLQVSFLFSYFKFHSVMFSILKRIFPSHQATLYAGVLALEYFPSIASESKKYAQEAISSFFKHPRRILTINNVEHAKESKPTQGIITRWIETLYSIVVKQMEG